ncbi:hypothetical protein [Wukongibacter baidiensis]
MYFPYIMPQYRQSIMSGNFSRANDNCDIFCKNPSKWEDHYALLRLRNCCYMFVYINSVRTDSLLCHVLCYEPGSGDPDEPCKCDIEKCHGIFGDDVLININDIHLAKIFTHDCVCEVSRPIY